MLGFQHKNFGEGHHLTHNKQVSGGGEEAETTRWMRDHGFPSPWWEAGHPVEGETQHGGACRCLLPE